MKIVQLIQEIGDADPNMAYPYALIDKGKDNFDDSVSYTYAFETEGSKKHEPTKYRVFVDKTIYGKIEDEDDDLAKYEVTYEVGFAVTDSNGKNINFDTDTNKGELYRVMATVVKIVKQRMSRDEKDGERVAKLYFSPSKTKGPGDERRSNLYAAYINKHIPNSTIKKLGHGFVVKINND